MPLSVIPRILRTALPVILLVAIASGGASAEALVHITPPGGGGGCTESTFLVDIYSPIGNEPATSAYVVVNGTTPYADDSDVAMCEDVAYSISASITDGVGYYYDFAHWYVVGGSVANEYSSKTTLTPSAPLTGAVIVMVVGETGYQNWGGYIGGGSHITAADGTFTVPSGPYTTVGGGCSYQEYLPIWVGIGGVNGNATLWQAGVTVEVAVNANCVSSLSMTAWYDYPGGLVYVPLTVCTNEPFTVDLTINGTGAWATFGSCGSYTAHVRDVVPDETTAEWVVESLGPETSGYAFMNFPTIDFGVGTYYDGGRGTTMGGPSAPLMEWTAIDQVLSGVSPFVYQYATPSFYSTTGFDVSYSQQSSL